MPVERLHGARHAVTVWKIEPHASKLPNRSGAPAAPPGGTTLAPPPERPPGRYVKSPIPTPPAPVEPFASFRGPARPVGRPPWLFAAARCPWVTFPVVFTRCLNG